MSSYTFKELKTFAHFFEAKKSISKREREKEEKRIFTEWLTPQIPTMPEIGLGWKEELGIQSKYPTLVTGTQLFESPELISWVHISGKLESGAGTCSLTQTL